MGLKASLQKDAPSFKRSLMVLGKPELPEPKSFGSGKKRILAPAPQAPSPVIDEEVCSVLVINSSQDMAKEITMELTLTIPGCSIMYAPTLDLARLLLLKRDIHLVVSNQILPDGNINRLKPTLEKMKDPPALVVVGKANGRLQDLMENSAYQIAALRKLAGQVDSSYVGPANPAPDSIKSLGANLRNDLNNPLQEIVAMVFVAQAGGKMTSQAQKALEAIDNAAKNMATVVKGLEDKIRKAVS